MTNTTCKCTVSHKTHKMSEDKDGIKWKDIPFHLLHIRIIHITIMVIILNMHTTCSAHQRVIGHDGWSFAATCFLLAVIYVLFSSAGWSFMAAGI